MSGHTNEKSAQKCGERGLVLEPPHSDDKQE